MYHISIIDYLQDWNCNKMGERFFKTVIQRKDKKMLSAIEPQKYGMRFQKFIEKNVLN